ncbi:ATP-binding cassette domain-containing protein [Campylobacter sp. JMF_06 NA1]|uniref:ABC transporter ATP-binding protein n=1 Tax=Campylobacter sp. JMF_06 NA1 TaxID=2983823 RepID=UPI0022E9B32E|nr:ATP-binding cassette domain-containing protein [Campylobacter sp. JMF_06 NA1]MDA3077856.1 ATP-binding cassette domain-containing protein [Campylobacter sp. JMF_06 NA1]
MIKIDCEKRLNENFKISVNLKIKKGSFVCLYGASGSGKTTILRLLAGFMKIDSGAITNGEITLDNGRKFMHAKQRKIGFLFQDYALFENMSVIENLLFAKKDLQKAGEMLKFLELEKYANFAISQLSGGQKQRVALARALMQSPEILLLDEPLSALDYKIREKIQDYLKKIHEKFRPTIILVSHDISEIYRLCERVYELKNGSLVREGSPSEIFLQTSGSQKFSFRGKVVALREAGGVNIAIIAVGAQLCEVVLSVSEARDLRVGDSVSVGAKAFNINLKKIEENSD